jgi:nucleoside-diphosphate-sugar epimerase
MTSPPRLRLLVIGGSGFLSGTLARRAIARGHQVWTVSRGQRPLPEGVTGIIAERHDREGFTAALAAAGVTWDLAVDCIAFTHDDIALDLAALAGRAAHLVFVSTDFVYDPAHRRVPQGEEAERYLSEGYGGLKRQAELVLERSGGELPWTTVRPCHIYGPGSQLGCLPLHGRDPRLIERLRAGEPLRLVGGGHFLQQPVLARDLADLFLSLAGNPATYRQTYCAAGPDIVESRAYYQIVADALGVPLAVEEVPVSAHLREHPEAAPFLCHRVYDMTKLRASGAAVPSTPLVDGLREHVASLLGA